MLWEGKKWSYPALSFSPGTSSDDRIQHDYWAQIMKEEIMWTISENKEWAALEQRFGWVKIMQEIPQDKIHHAEGNVAVHTQMVLNALMQDAAWQQLPEQDRETLWASALLHDVEKAGTMVTEPDGRITSKGHARHEHYPADAQPADQPVP